MEKPLTGLLLCAVLLALGGCDGGRDTEFVVEREYDLAGCWEVNERPFCVSGLHSDAELDDLELGRVEAEPWEIRQSGGDLTIIDTEDGGEYSGAVTGSEVRYGRRETVPYFEVELEANGTVLSDDVMSVSETYTFTSDDETLEVACELHLERMVDVPAGCIAAGGE